MPHTSDEDLEPIVGAFLAPDPALFRVTLTATGDELGGDLCELGVSDGRSAVLVGGNLREGETFRVIDLFEEEASYPVNAAENSSSYPGLTRDAFEARDGDLHDELPSIVRGLSSEILKQAATPAVADGLNTFVISPSKMYATWGAPEPWQRHARAWAAGADALFETQTTSGLEVLRIGPPALASTTPHPMRKYVPPALWPHVRRLRRVGSS